MDNPVLLVVMLMFIAFAQVTTNILNSVVPPAYAMTDMFRLPPKAAEVIVGLLAFATFPWLLVRDESGAGLGLFIRTYSAFLGPIFAILLVDYYVIRRRTLNLTHLFDDTGPYQG